MSSLRPLGAAALAVVLGSMFGCSSAPEKEVEDVGTVENELKLSGVGYLGAIANGETKSGYYFNPPRYRAFGFYAKGGDEITVDVKSLQGDAMGWITNSSYTVLAQNDDVSSYNLDSRVVYKVPAGRPSRAHRIVFRDYDHLDATFTVKLSIKSAATTCAYDGENYAPGESFPATDGCNTCTCSASGLVGCTKMACPVCDPANEPWREYKGTPETCMLIRYTCSAGMTSFSNACGCGCE